MSTDRCKSCGKVIVWAKNDKTGKAAPIDATPDSAGPVVLRPDGTYHVLSKAERAEPVTAYRHTPHFMTCPDREAWKGAYSR